MTLTLVDFHPHLNGELLSPQSRGRCRGEAARMKLELKEGPKSYRLVVEAPGVPKGSIKMSFENGVLNLSAEHSRNKAELDRDEQVLFSERSYGNFSRQIRLPKNVDGSNITARLENGILAVDIPKSEKHQTQVIPIQ